MTNLGNRIRALRKEAGLTQEALAWYAELSVRAYSSIERGEACDPHYSTLKGIAEALGITVSQLLEDLHD